MAGRWLTENAIDTPWTAGAICEGCGAETADQRSVVRDAVRYCVGAGFLIRTETKIGPVCQLTGRARVEMQAANTLVSA